MRKRYVILSVILLIPILYVISCYRSGHEQIPNKISFAAKLSSYGLFQGNMAALIPNKGVHLLEISSSLFTDYADKQRLLKLPEGSKMIAQGNGLPKFPEGTLIAKTFFYAGGKEGSKAQLIETRLLLLKDGHWNATTYRWNEEQTDADLLQEGAFVNVKFQDGDRRFRDISYRIPAQRDCATCHRVNDRLVPIGPKLENLNKEILRNGKRINQLDYLKELHLLEMKNRETIAALPDYNDVHLSLDKRARAYFEMNCAHCHNPAGMAFKQNLNLHFSVPYKESGIELNKGNITMRMATMGTYHMPKIGTTILHEEGIMLIKEYIDKLAN